MDINKTKQLVEKYLSNYFSERREAASALHPAYEQLWISVEHLFRAGGKRVRPHLALLIYKAYSRGSASQPIVPALAALEILHMATLIHDDIIDRDTVRYGASNVTGQYSSTYKDALLDEAERRHFAESAALLAGDVLLSDCYLLLSRATAASDIITEAQLIVNQAFFTVMGGELLDTEAPFVKDPAAPSTISLLKTASYSFVCPLLVGATFAKAPESEKTKLQQLGRTIGVAYQLQDDALGMFVATSVTGKSDTSDLEEGKITELILYFREHATEAQKSDFNKILGNGEVSSEQAQKAKQLLVASGAKDAIEHKINELYDAAYDMISQLNITDSQKNELTQFVQSLSGRVR